MSNETKRVTEDVKEKSIPERITEAFKKGAARIDEIVKSNTDTPEKKKVADAVLDVFEEVSDFMPGLLDKVIDFATSRVRKRYDIPDND